MAVFRMTVKGIWQGQEWRNVFYCSDTAKTVIDFQSTVDAVVSSYQGLATGTLSQNWNLYGVDMKQVDASSMPTVEYLPTGGTIVGNQTLTATASQIALLVSWKGLTAPPNRVRKYLCGFMGGQMNTDGTWGTATITAATTWAAAIESVGSSDPNLAFPVSVKFNDLGVVTDWNAVSIAVARQVPATQRRRRLGVGI